MGKDVISATSERRPDILPKIISKQMDKNHIQLRKKPTSQH